MGGYGKEKQIQKYIIKLSTLKVHSLQSFAKKIRLEEVMDAAAWSRIFLLCDFEIELS